MNTYPMYTQQRGAALVISLVMLATATMVGVAGMMGAVTEERIAANQRQITSAFMSAETGVSSGYAQLIDPDTDFQWPDAADWAADNWKPRGDAHAGNPMAGSALQDCILVYGAENVVGSPDRIECRPRLKDENNPQAGFIIKVKNSEINARGNTDGNRWYIEHLRFVHAVYEAGEYVYKVPRLDANGDEVKDGDENLVYDTVNHATPGAVQIATMRVKGVVDNAERTIEIQMMQPVASAGYDEDDPFGWGVSGDPPAAVSCLGGACSLHAGAAAGVKVDGRDHPYPIDCAGSSCWLSHKTPMISPKPSVFLSHFSGSSVTRQGGGPNPPYCGANSSTPEDSFCGEDKNSASVWQPSNYPNDAETGESTAPTRAQYFSSEFLDRLEPHRGNSEFGAWITNAEGVKEYQPKVTFYDPDATNNPTGNDNNAGILVVDGTNYNRTGTGVFVGLVVVINCGKVSTGGNFNIYGAILIDAGSCEETNYDPYGGAGTPSIRFSRDALGLAGRALNEGEGGGEGDGDGGKLKILSWNEV